MDGDSYAESVCNYIARRYSNRGIELYREVSLGKSIIGKNRRVDIFVLHRPTNRALALECKYQGSSGTTDEKIPYTIDDLRAMRMPACVVYGGDGFSEGVKHMLRACNMAAYCLPESDNPKDIVSTKELDHVLAMRFDWWDIVVKESQRFSAESSELMLPGFEVRPVIARKRRDAKPAAKAVTIPAPLPIADET